jgi:hypothetical protein
VYNRDADEGHTAQDQENREWRPSDILLVGIALIILLAVMVFVCAGYPWIGAPRSIFGF